MKIVQFNLLSATVVLFLAVLPKLTGFNKIEAAGTTRIFPEINKNFLCIQKNVGKACFFILNIKKNLA